MAFFSLHTLNRINYLTKIIQGVEYMENNLFLISQSRFVITGAGLDS